ncbi:hypothetical protein AAFC00_002074 [Neodothiora populina]|uniref:Helicase C-terminal domain-containing protein n=1 Tax=Neodothiora populina TaxID=2781224 RepID=A0ABR3PGG1_9PEZI
MADHSRPVVVVDLDDHRDSDLDTPATSVSPLTPVPAKTSTFNTVPRSPEASRFFQDIKNYIPLGCLVQETKTVTDHSNLCCHKWKEVTRPASIPGLPDKLVQGITKLLENAWIRVSANCTGSAHISRLYFLPGDVGNRYVDHSSKVLSRAVHSLVRELDVSPATWEGKYIAGNHVAFDPLAAADEGSLYYMFNTLKSPAPSPEHVTSHFHREALGHLLDHTYDLPGLRSVLYPYQRRSAGLMLQRESESRLELDPRLEQRIAPDGSMYFYGPREAVFFRSPKYYESCKGGILAETMGLGKTVMCIALILTTKGYLPKVPAQYETIRKRSRVGSLAEMAVSSVNKHSAPWKTFFADHAARTGEYMEGCIKLLRQNAPIYEIPQEPIRWNRKTTTPPPKRLMLASTTIIVVPRNLFAQWRAEMDKHVEKDALSVLFMDDPKTDLPDRKELTLYDVILFSRTRFEQEHKDGSDRQGRRQVRYPVSCNCPYIGASRRRDCTCLREEDLYDSPLKHIHFLRLIIDEGHFFSSSRSVAAHVANQMVVTDHRWVVSGTPAKDLLGVELDSITSDPTTVPDEQRRGALAQRRKFNVKEDTSGAIRSLGELVTHFLKIRPWTASEERSAEWKYDIYRFEDPRTKIGIAAFSKSLGRTLESIVVKTQPEDIERDIVLPPLEHRIVRLKPCLFDKYTANAFNFVLTANAVTSERTDTDYLFHPNSQKERYQLVYNLRQSAFTWTGFSEADILATIGNSERYLAKVNTGCTAEDRALLKQCVEEAKSMLSSPCWTALSRSHEVGLSVNDWPEDCAEFWSFNEGQAFLCGVTQLLEAQAFVNQQAESEDPTSGLAGTGLRALKILRTQQPDAADGHEKKSILAKGGVPSSSVSVQSKFDHRRHNMPAREDGTKRSTPKNKSVSAARTSTHDQSGEPQELPANSPLLKTSVTGTTSAKLSYLMSKIWSLYRDEKILVFYDGDNSAYYIAQALELLHINHLIYERTLSPVKKSEYIVLFDKDSSYRVLLMDVRQAAYGLNVSSASRVFFINFCRPQIEAQAIKRAHRIGQTKPVVVETLILEGTIEEEMFERARRMTRAEHSDAKMLDDDRGIKEIIQQARPLPISDEDRNHNVALLADPQQLWSRAGWATWKKKNNATIKDEKHSKGTNELLSSSSNKKRTAAKAIPEDDQNTTATPSKKQKTTSTDMLRNTLIENPSEPARIIDAAEDSTAPVPIPQPSVSHPSVVRIGQALSSSSSQAMNQIFAQRKATAVRRVSLFGGGGGGGDSAGDESGK